MADDQVKVSIIADASGVAPGVNVAKAAVQGLSESTQDASVGMRASFASVSASVEEMGIRIRESVGVVGEMREAMMAFGEAMIAAFAIEKIADWSKEMGEAAEKNLHMAETFGMTVPQMQGLQGVASQVGMSIDALAKGMAIFDKNMVAAASGTGTAAAAFKAMGINANDGKTQIELLLAVADKFAAMEDGPKKVARAMELFGRAGKEMVPLLNEGAEGIKRMDKANIDYSAGVVEVTAANKDLFDWLEKVKANGIALAEANNTSKVAMQGLGNVMTDTFAPALTQVSLGFNELVKSFIDSYREGGAMGAVMDALAGTCAVLWEAIKTVCDVIGALWDVVKTSFKDIAELFGFTFEQKAPDSLSKTKMFFNELIDIIVIFKDVCLVACQTVIGYIDDLKVNIQGAMRVIWDAIDGHWAQIEADWRRSLKEIADNAVQEAHRTASAWKEATEAIAAFKAGKNVNDKGEGAGEAKQTKDSNPSLTKAAKAKADSGDKDNSAATDLEEAKDNAKAKEAIAASSAKTVEELTKLSAQEQLDAVNKAEASGVITKRQATAQKIAIMASEVQAEITAANTIYQAKVAEIKAEESAEAASYDKKMAQLDKTIPAELTKWNNLFNEKQAKQQAADNQLEVLAAQHENQLTLINAKGLADRSKAEVKDVSQRVAMEKTAVDSISQSWSSALSKMMTGQMSFTKGLQSMYMGVVNMISGALAGMIQKWLQQQLMALILGRTQQGITGVAQVTSNAAVAGAAAFASTAAIPLIGPELAPAAAAAAFTGAMAFAPLASAAGGWGDVPYVGAGIDGIGGQLGIVHPREMVLPANLATPLRSMLTSGGVNDNAASSAGSFGGSGGGDTIHIHAVDARSFERMLRTNRAAVGSAVRDYVRYNGATK